MQSLQARVRSVCTCMLTIERTVMMNSLDISNISKFRSLLSSLEFHSNHLFFYCSNDCLSIAFQGDSLTPQKI